MVSLKISKLKVNITLMLNQIVVVMTPSNLVAKRKMDIYNERNGFNLKFTDEYY